MTTTRTVRQRSCIACGKLAGKAELMRIVRDPSGAVSFDKTGRAPGRGAYVCSEECFAAACKKKKLDRALKATLGSDEYDRIAADVASAAREARQKERSGIWPACEYMSWRRNSICRAKSCSTSCSR